MRTSSRESLSMTITTLSASWCVGINRLCEVCFANSPALISPWPTICRRKLLSALTNTSAVFAEKRVSRPGFTGSPITVFGKMRGVVRNLSVSMTSNYKRNTTLRLPTPV